MSIYKEHTKFYVALDVIIFGFDQTALKLLLIKRNFEPCLGQWSLMGGFLREDESADEAAHRILFELTGLQKIYLEQLYAYGQPSRDPADRVISLAYYALIRTEDYISTNGEKMNASWFDIKDMPNLIFDHNQMVDKALKRLQRKSKTQPIGFELLPEHFTLPQLQMLYEAIHQTEFDKRNFRKKLLAMDLLKKLEIKDHSTSKKGAYLYEFDMEKYHEFVESGFHFALG